MRVSAERAEGRNELDCMQVSQGALRHSPTTQVLPMPETCLQARNESNEQLIASLYVPVLAVCHILIKMFEHGPVQPCIHLNFFTNQVFSKKLLHESVAMFFIGATSHHGRIISRCSGLLMWLFLLLNMSSSAFQCTSCDGCK